MGGRPTPNEQIRDIDPTPLSETAAGALKRVRVFLFGVAHTGRQVPVMLLGYTADHHRTGVYLTRHLSGEIRFAEWRMYRALRPPRDPDMPVEIATMERFVERWLARAQDAVRTLDDDEDRAELTTYLEFEAYASRTWSAKAAVQRLRGLAKPPCHPYTTVWQALDVEAFEAEVRAFDAALAAVQRCVEEGPIDAAEIVEMHAARESTAKLVTDWLAERAEQLAALGELELTVLGLGALEPPDGFDAPAAMLGPFGSAGQA